MGSRGGKDAAIRLSRTRRRSPSSLQDRHCRGGRGGSDRRGNLQGGKLLGEGPLDLRLKSRGGG